MESVNDYAISSLTFTSEGKELIKFTRDSDGALFVEFSNKKPKKNKLTEQDIIALSSNILTLRNKIIKEVA